jgi:hypothetical protein
VGDFTINASGTSGWLSDAKAMRNGDTLAGGRGDQLVLVVLPTVGT